MKVPDTPLFDPNDFYIQPDVTHVCAAGETAFLRRHEIAFAKYFSHKSAGAKGRHEQDAIIEHTRAQMAQFWNVEAGDIGWVSNVAEGISIVLESFKWEKGDVINVMPSEYPSLVAPLMASPDSSYQVRFAQASTTESLIESITADTKIIMVSYVSYLNGARFDLQAIRKAADTVNAILIVDFTQASGYLPIEAAIADFAFCSSYKWMLGTTGVATAYWNRLRQPFWSPSSAGWFSLSSDSTDLQNGITLKPDAMRFSRGNPAHLSLYILSSALDYLSAFSPRRVQEHVQLLTTDLLARLDSHGIVTTTPVETSNHGASVCLSRPDAHELLSSLDSHGILAWNGRGRLRISFHGYNSSKDVERIEDVFIKVLNLK